MIDRNEIYKKITSHYAWTSCSIYKWQDLYLDLHGVDLSGMDLHNQSLAFINLNGANLSNCNLLNADLRKCDLRNANFTNAYLSHANLRDSLLSNANFLNADLTSAYIKGIEFEKAINKPYVPSIRPKGEFIGYKALRYGKIAVLLIYEDSIVCNAFNRRCRTNKCKVLAIENTYGGEYNSIGYSLFSTDYTYTKGQEIIIENFDTDRWLEATNGVHFFLTREEAIEYGKY